MQRMFNAKKSLRKFVLGNDKDTGECCRTLLENPDEYRDKVCVHTSYYPYPKGNLRSKIISPFPNFPLKKGARGI